MIELDEKDVKAVANSRFFWKYKWWILGITLSILIVMPLVGLTSNPESWTRFLICIPGSVYFGSVILYLIKSTKAEKALIEEWKKEKSSDTIS